MKLRPYQETGRDFLAARTRALLGDEMRIGKTPQAILACEKLGVQSVLVLCPAIAVEHWKREFPKWAPDYRPNLDVMSFDRARIDADTLLKRWWDVMIVDEAHFARNPAAKRTKLVYGKDGYAWRSKYVWALSGTPAPKHAAELWPMLRAFGVVKMTYPEFVRRYCYCEWLTGRILGTRTPMIPELRELLAKVMLRRTRKDVAPEMPGIDYQFLNVDPVAGVDIEMDAPDVESMLHQFADRDDRQAVALAKVKSLFDRICFALAAGLVERTVVFGWHVAPLNELCRLLRHAGYSAEVLNGATSPRQRVVIQDKFGRGTIQVICANVLAAGTAIDLSAAAHAYFLELDWVPANNVQAANRLISMQKAEPVTVDVVNWPGSIDEAVQRVLMRRIKELSQLY